MGTGQVDFQLQDNGTVEFTLGSFVDAKGNPTNPTPGTAPATATSSDPNLVVTPDQTDTSGFALKWIGTPTGLATGVVVTFVFAGVTVAATPVDIVAGPVAGFQVTEAANPPA